MASRRYNTGRNKATQLYKFHSYGIPQTLEVDSLLHVQNTILRREQHSYWHLIIIMTLRATTIFGIFCFSSRFYLYHKFLCHCSKHTLLKQNTEIQILPASTSEPNQKAIEHKNDNPQRNVTFTTYSLQPVNILC